MPRRIITTATYDGDAREIFMNALEPAEAEAASKGYTTFSGMPDHPLREGDTYKLDVTTLKIFKTKGYQIHMEKVDHEACVFISREKGGAVKSWHHHMSVVQDGEQAVWTDDVTIDAGWLTWLVARIGLGMYRYRHESRKARKISSQMHHVT